MRPIVKSFVNRVIHVKNMLHTIQCWCQVYLHSTVLMELSMDLRCHESPRFQIFLTRFLKPPKLIVYDNACKLHQYSLNREPDNFKFTKFLIDKFHWKGHVGCSSRYNLTKYPTFDMTAINSQVNEQANAGLQRIKSHVSYMKEENFVSFPYNKRQQSAWS